MKVEIQNSNYIHPKSHSANMIDETETRKFISKKEKEEYSDKYNKEETNTLLSDKVDKELDKSLSTNDFDNNYKNKLDNIENEANKYIHPDKHSADMIDETETKNFVSLEEKKQYLDKYSKSETNTLLSDKVDKELDKSLSTNDFDNNYKNKVDSIENEANKYVHPDKHSADMILETENKKFVTTSEKNTWSDKYSKNEVDNKFSAFETNVDWKESVNTFSDITTAYPNAQDGWTVNVKDTDYTYRYNGSKWVAISANAIPKATQEVDGLLTKEDYSKIIDSDNKKHTHTNKNIIDTITQQQLETWNSVSNKVDKVAGKNLFSGSYNDLINKPIIPTTLPASGGNADTIDNKHSTEFVNTFFLPAPMTSTKYFKIAELTTNIAPNLNGLTLIISGVSDFGNNKVGIDMLQVSTRGNVCLQVYNILDSDDSTIYGYINKLNGKTEIWTKRITYAYPASIAVLSSIDVTYGLLIEQIQEPEGIIYVDKIKYIKATDIIKQAVNADTLDNYHAQSFAKSCEITLEQANDTSFPTGIYNLFNANIDGINGGYFSIINCNHYRGIGQNQQIIINQDHGSSEFGSVYVRVAYNGEWKPVNKVVYNNDLNNYIPTTASCNKNWNWSGLSGQPNWVWGGEYSENMYVYNPRNFSVAYADHSLFMRTFDAKDASHEQSWLLKCRHNIYGDNRFGLYLVNPGGIELRVDYSTNSLNSNNADTVDNIHIWSGTQAQYNTIATKDTNTLYLIID